MALYAALPRPKDVADQMLETGTCMKISTVEFFGLCDIIIC